MIDPGKIWHDNWTGVSFEIPITFKSKVWDGKRLFSSVEDWQVAHGYQPAPKPRVRVKAGRQVVA